MKKIKHETILNWERSCNQIAYKFIQTYFGKLSEIEHWWVADEVGSVMFINDYFFSMTDMVDYIKYNYNTVQMFNYYDYALSCVYKNKVPINIKNWRKLKVK